MAKRKTTTNSDFTASDFSIKAASTGTIDVSNVTGAGQVGVSTSYPASAELVVTEASATITNISAIDVTADFGNSITVNWTDPGTIFAGTSGVDFDVVYTLADDAVAGTTLDAKVQITLDDDTVGETLVTSTAFELSATGDARMEVFAPQSVEWRGRMIGEGLI